VSWPEKRGVASNEGKQGAADVAPPLTCVRIFLDPSTDPDTAFDNLMSYQQPPNQLNDGNILVDSTELLLFHYKDGYVECLPFVMVSAIFFSFAS
jgi:hypothetical protein